MPKYETFTYFVDEKLPAELVTEVKEGLDSVVYEGTPRFKYSTEDDADVKFLVTEGSPEDSTSEIFLQGKLLVVGHPYWIKDSMTSEELPKWKFIVLESDKTLASIILESRVGEGFTLQTIPTIEEMISTLETSDDTVGLVSIKDLDRRLRLLRFDSAYYLDDPTTGSLNVKLDLVLAEDTPEFVKDIIPVHVELNEQEAEDPTTDRILSLRMTGVTAISRNLAIKVERSGDYTYPAHKIADFLKSADLTHTSNEVSFVPGCVPEQSMRFCASPNYIQALEASGIDIVELTGNHNNDYGSQYNGETMKMYEDRGWIYFGGGKNIEDASQIRYVEKDGAKVAFIGYNWYDTTLGTLAIAGETRPGANSYSESKMAADIAEAKKNADTVIVDFQFQECYSYPENDVIYPPCYRALSSPDQKGVFRKAVDLGADIVIGAQAHQPQTYEIYNDKMIFYGLGNLFFDQISWIGTRQGIILTHYFVDGEYVQTKIDTTIYDGDMKPYVTEGAQREQLLKLLNDAR